MVEADAIIAVFQRQDALNLVRLDHGLEYVAHEKRFLPRASQVVGQSENAAEIIRGMSPLGGEPSVVEIEPADHRADVEGGMHRFQLPIGAGNPRAVRQDRAGNDRPQVLRAFGIAQREQSAAERVQKIVTGGIDGLAAAGNIVGRVVGDLD